MLVNGQQPRTTHELVRRRGLSRNEDRILIGRWFYEQRQARAGLAGIDTSAADGSGPVEPKYGLPELAAMHRLVGVARGNTGQSRKATNFLLTWWNAGGCGGWNLTELWDIDQAIADDMLAVNTFISRHREYPTAYDLGAEFEGLVGQWRLQLLDQPE